MWEKRSKCPLTGNEVVETPFSTYEVNSERYCINERPKTLSDVFEYIKSELHKYDVDLDEYDYLHPEQHYGSNRNDPIYWPLSGEYRWIACFAVKGGSEGYYVHVEVIGEKDRGTRHLILGKTLLEGKSGREHALKLSNALAMIVELEN